MMLDHLLEYLRKYLFYYLVYIKIDNFFRGFHQVDAKFSKSTLNRAATCIQRWWRGFIVRHRWSYLKNEVCIS
jgi:hypothetical protein